MHRDPRIARSFSTHARSLVQGRGLHRRLSAPLVDYHRCTDSCLFVSNAMRHPPLPVQLRAYRGPLHTTGALPMALLPGRLPTYCREGCSPHTRAHTHTHTRAGEVASLLDQSCPFGWPLRLLPQLTTTHIVPSPRATKSRAHPCPCLAGGRPPAGQERGGILHSCPVMRMMVLRAYGAQRKPAAAPRDHWRAWTGGSHLTAALTPWGRPKGVPMVAGRLRVCVH